MAPLVRRLYLQVDTIVGMAKTAELKIQKWGNSLAVRIPSSVAKRAGFQAGQPVRLSMQDESVLVSPTGKPVLTLAQRLARFDPQRHEGEAMVTERAGREVF
jgi:antitoxin MazE